MQRIITNPKPWGDTTTPIPSSQGGFGELSELEVLQNFDLEPLDKVGQAGYTVPLDENGVIKEKYLGGIVNMKARVDGDAFIQVGETKEYYLTTYDCFTEYDIRPYGGTVERDGAVIRFTAGNTTGEAGFIVNDYVCKIEIQGEAVTRPDIVFPGENANDIGTTLRIVASGFRVVGSDTHKASDWQLATDPNFTSIKRSSYNNTKNLTDWDVNGLSNNTTYYARVRYHSTNSGNSAWSDSVSFVTYGSPSLPVEISTITKADTLNLQFGYSIAMNAAGDFMAVATGDNSGNLMGAVYIYYRVGDNWNHAQTITPPAGASPSSNFGIGLAMGRGVAYNATGGLLLIGADSEDNLGTDRGCVYVYRKTTSSAGGWTYQQTLTAHDASNGDAYGNCIAINNDSSRVLIGVLGDDDKGSYSGSVYYYTVQNQTIFNFESKFYAQDAAAGLGFGSSVAMNEAGDLCVVGANRDNINGTESGSAYVLKLVNEIWKPVTKIIPADGVAGDNFGVSVAMTYDYVADSETRFNGNLILIGAHGYDDEYGLTGVGKVYAYARTALDSELWRQIYVFKDPIPEYNQAFGLSVGCDAVGNYITIGSPNETVVTEGNRSGVVHYYRKP